MKPTRIKPISYVKANAALGGISLALKLGEAIIAAEKKGGSAVIDAIVKTTGGTILAKGKVTAKGKVIDAMYRVVDKMQVEVMAFVDQAITDETSKDVKIEEQRVSLTVKLVDERPVRNPTLETIERAYIAWVLQNEAGHKTRAAEVLGIDPSTLHRKLARYGLDAAGRGAAPGVRDHLRAAAQRPGAADGLERGAGHDLLLARPVRL